jgi:hypothetical protein
MKLIKSPLKTKKWRAIFDDGSHTDFGLSNAKDYTLSNGDEEDKKMRELYRKRHLKDLKTNDPKRAGYLSFFLLWGDSKNLKTNLKNYRKMFNL